MQAHQLASTWVAAGVGVRDCRQQAEGSMGGQWTTRAVALHASTCGRACTTTQATEQF